VTGITHALWGSPKQGKNRRPCSSPPDTRTARSVTIQKAKKAIALIDFTQIVQSGYSLETLVMREVTIEPFSRTVKFGIVALESASLSEERL
jgi:hypothetical protein